MYLIRFDMRAPEKGATPASLYQAAIEMSAWSETRGCVVAVLSEHHASPDGYLPSPLILASAIAARTEHLLINIAALVLPLYDPIKVAEDIAVLDILAQGRVSYVMAMGYRDEEYAMFGVERRQRARRLEANIRALRQAWSGEPFHFEGREVHATPTPFTPGGPSLALGGGTLQAARRAGRLGMDLLASSATPGLEEAYREEASRAGQTPGNCRVPDGAPTTVFVAEDLDRAWERLGPYLLHDAQSYAAWLKDQPAASRSLAQTIDELRTEQGSYRIVTPEGAADLIRQHGILSLQPLCGGTPPELGWETLKLVHEKVLPALAS